MNPSVSVAVEVTPPVTTVLELGGRPRAARRPPAAGVRRSVWALGTGWPTVTPAGAVEVSLGSGPHDTGEYLLGVGAVAGAIAAADFSDDDGGANGLFGTPVGRVDRRIPQEGEHGRELGRQVRGEAVGIVEPRRRVDQPSEAGEQSAARGGQAVVGQTSAVAAVAQVEGRLQDVLDVGGPQVVRMVVPEFPAPSSRCARHVWCSASSKQR